MRDISPCSSDSHFMKQNENYITVSERAEVPDTLPGYRWSHSVCCSLKPQRSRADLPVCDLVGIRARRVGGGEYVCVCVCGGAALQHSLRLPRGWSLMQIAGTASRPQRIMLMSGKL